MKYIFLFLVVALMATMSLSTDVTGFSNNLDAGIRLKEISDNEIDGYTTIAIQMKLPQGTVGIKELQTVISFDRETLTPVSKIDNSITYISDLTNPIDLSNTDTFDSDVVDVKIIDENNSEYYVIDAVLCSQVGYNTVETIKVSLITFANPSEEQANDSWQDVFYLKFKTNTQNPINEDSIWFSTKEFVNTDLMYKNLALGSNEWLNFFDTVNSNDSNINSFGFIPTGKSNNREMMTATDTGVFISNKFDGAGDVNADNAVTAADAKAVMEYIVGLNTIVNDSNFHIADVDSSGQITALDAMIIMKKTVNLE